LFERGFRPFFFGAAAFGALALPVWLGLLVLGWTLPTSLAARDWHVHEMIFGYVPAVLAGFLLTAIPNWTGRLPVAGRPLMLLAALWLAGRLAMAVSALAPVACAVIDAGFLIALAAVAWREVVAGKKIRHAPICVLVTLFALANVGFHVAALGDIDRTLAERLALAVIAFLISLIGGRIVPSFTCNWMAQAGRDALPASLGIVDKAALAATGVGLVGWIIVPENPVTAALLAVSAALMALRLARWRGWSTAREPLVLILHVGYGWLPVWMALTAARILWPDVIDASTAMHALTAGAIGTMTVAVMSRATLGHSGRPLAADRLTVAIYALITAGAALRILTPFLPLDYTLLLTTAGLFWSAGLALFVVGYAPIFFRAR
jgi:uncharacterized protein involved in response to NO